MRQLFFLLILLVLGSCTHKWPPDSKYPHVNKAREIVASTNKNFAKKGIYEYRKVYSYDSEIGEFDHYYIATKYCITDIDEARTFFHTFLEEFLEPLNNDERLRPYLKNYPLTWENVDVDIIFVNEKEELFSVPYFSHIGKQGPAIVYELYDPETKEARVFLAEDLIDQTFYTYSESEGLVPFSK